MLSTADEAMMKSTRMRKRVYEVIQQVWISDPGSNGVGSTRKLFSQAPPLKGRQATFLSVIIPISLQAAVKSSERPQASKHEAVGGNLKSLHFQFYRNPVEVIVNPSTGAASGLRVEITALKQGPDGQAVAHGTGTFAYAQS